MTVRTLVMYGMLLVVGLAAGAWGVDVPRSARMIKEAGNDFLAAKRYADAIDCYLQALEIYPDFAEAHYNLGVAFLKGYRAYHLARFHFERYLALRPEASDREDVETLVDALAEREAPLPSEPGRVVAVVGDRLVVSGKEWIRPGERIEVVDGEVPCASLVAQYVYPDCILTQRIRDARTLERIQPGLAVATGR